MKTAHIRLRVDVLEKFAIDYNLTAHIFIRYDHGYIVQGDKHKT